MTATIEELSERFHATYATVDQHGFCNPAYDHDLNECSSEPTPLSRIIETCKEFECDADLFDSKGNRRGWVHSTGRSSVGDGQ